MQRAAGGQAVSAYMAKPEHHRRVCRRLQNPLFRHELCRAVERARHRDVGIFIRGVASVKDHIRGQMYKARADMVCELREALGENSIHLFGELRIGVDIRRA